MRRKSLVLCFVSASLWLLVSATGLAAPGSPLRVSFIDVGQGDASLVRGPDGFDALVDGGPPAAGPTVVAYLRQQGVDQLDVMLVTHADLDHVGGLIDVLDAPDLPVRRVLYNGYPGTTRTWQAFTAAVAAEGLTLEPAQYPANYAWGEVAVHVLSPPPGLESPPQNEACVATRLDYGDRSFMLACDVDAAVEGDILARGTPVAADVLKVAHHGSQYGSSAAFLAASQPKEAVISVGTNTYGQPAAETLARLQTAGARIWRTDRVGTITALTDGAALTMTLAIDLRPVAYLPFVWMP